MPAPASFVADEVPATFIPDAPRTFVPDKRFDPPSLSPVLSTADFETPKQPTPSETQLNIAGSGDLGGKRQAEVTAMNMTQPEIDAANLKAWEAFQAPQIPLPRIKINPEDSRIVAAGKQAVNVAIGLPEFFTSPMGYFSVAAGAVSPTATAGVFTADLLHSLGKQVQQNYTNWETMTPAEQGVAISDMIGTGVFAGLTGHGTVKGARINFDLLKEKVVPGSVDMPMLETKAEAEQRFTLIANLEQNAAPMTAKVMASGGEMPRGETTFADRAISSEPKIPGAEPVFPPTEPVVPSVETPVTPATETKAGPGLVDLGAATPEEVAPTGTALKNAVGELERVGHGLPEQYPTQRRSMAEAWIRSGDTLVRDPQAGQKLADELKHNPERGMTDDDSALLLRHKVALENAKNQAASDTFTANTPEAKAEAQARFDGLSNQLLDLLDAAKFRGSQWGREGRWRQALAFDDYSLETMTRDKRLALGRELTPEESAQVKALNEKISSLEQQLSDKEKVATETQRTTAADETVAEVGQKVKGEKASGETRDLVKEKENAIGNLKDRFIEQGDLVGGNTSIRKLMELLYDEGFTERVKLEQEVHRILKELVEPDITLQETQDLMSGYGNYKLLDKDPTKTGVRQIVGEIQSVRKLLDFFQGRAPSKTGQERQIPSDIKRQLDKVVAEAKKRFGTISTDPAKALKSALDAIETRLKNRITDLRQEISNRKLIVREKSPTPYNAETLRLRAELETVLKEHRELFPKEPLTPEQRLKIAESSAQRQIVELERQIKTGEIFPEGKHTAEQRSATLDAAKARIEELKAERDALRESIQPTLEPEARQLQQILTRLRQREADYRERLATGNFEPRARPEQPVSPAVLDARARVETAKRDFQKVLTLDKMKRRSVPAKVYAALKETLNLPRAFLSSMDVSAVLRQGGFIAFGHPLRAAKSIVPMFKALASEKQALRVEQEILSRPNAGRYASSKLYLASFDEFRLSKQEEIMMSRFANAVPGVRMSNRAFMVFLNKLRADSFDAMTASLEKRGLPLAETELAAISNYINIATGRGNLGSAAGAAETLATAFFSPRLVASRFQLLAGEPLYRGSAQTRVLIASEYARMLAGLSVVYGLGALAGAEMENDPRSTDFGKLKFGNTRIDPMMGLSQNTVLISRLASGEMKTGRERIVPIRGQEVKFGSPTAADLLARFARTKLAPTIGTGVDILSGKNVVGQEVTPATAALNLVTPLSLKDIYDVMIEQGVPEGTAIGILSLFGMSIQNYEVGSKP